MSGHWPDGSARPYSNDIERCECGVALDYNGDCYEQAWCAADGSDAPCPVWDDDDDEPCDNHEHVHPVECAMGDCAAPTD